jgi:hypothetical protein
MEEGDWGWMGREEEEGRRREEGGKGRKDAEPCR